MSFRLFRSPRPALLPDPASSRGESLRRLLLGTLPGRVLVIGAATRLLVAALSALIQPLPAAIELVGRAGTLALLAGGGYFLYRLAVVAKRRLLWRVRRKLILSYIFIGVVPALLIVAFFVLCGVLLFSNVSSYLVQNRLQHLTDQALFLARMAALEIQRAPEGADLDELLDRKQASAASEYPAASMAVVPASVGPCAERADASARARARGGPPGVARPLIAGPWRHLPPPEALPSWIGCDGFGGILAYAAPGAGAGGGDTRLAIRAAVVPDGASASFAVVLDLPVTAAIAERLREETGIEMSLTGVPIGGRESVRPAAGPLSDQSAAPLEPEAPQSPVRPDRPAGLFRREWVAFLDYKDWDTGRTGSVTVAIGMSIADIYDRISAAQTRIGNFTFGQVLLILLAVVGILFLIIEFVALVMGLALAKSITGSVHELFVGTERVRQGDFTHKIAIKAHDQLGELAESFNSMTASIEELLRQAAEKKRLEEELRIAREIQMSLLPQGPLQMPGLSTTAICVPAREVGGDYYDYFPLGNQRVGLLIADVSGKGTSAALYMAEMKGLMLSLCQIHRSPRELLINANRIIAEHLSSSSFITMIYAVIDLREGTMRYARAGHTPLIYLPGNPPGGRVAQILTPVGMVLGLKLDGGEKFEQLLEEATLALRPGDLVLLFTDGISEAMNADADCFGESRLARIVEEHGHLPFQELRERILREIDAFVGGAAQHDDMTMLLLKVDDTVAVEEAAAASVAAADP